MLYESLEFDLETGLETATKRLTHTLRDSAEAIAEIRLFLEPEQEEPEHEGR